MVPITAYPMSTSDKSSEYEAMQNSKLLKDEDTAASKIKGAQAIGQFTGNVIEAIDTGKATGIEAEKADASVESLDWVYQHAPENSKHMSDYAQTQLELAPEDMVKMEPMLRSVMIESKRQASPKPIYDFYKMIDDMKQAKLDALAKVAKAKKEDLTGTPALDFYTKARAEYTTANPDVTRPKLEEVTAFISANPELAAERSKLDAKNANDAIGQLFKEDNATARDVQYSDKVGSDLNKAVGTDANHLIANQMVTVSENFPDLRIANENLRTAIDNLPEDKKRGWDENIANAFKIYISNKLTNTDNPELKDMKGAILPEDIQLAIAKNETVTGPLWQLIITHLKNISGAAVTDSEYRRFSDALGLSSPNATQQENSIAYFIGTSLATQEAELNGRLGALSSDTRQSLVNNRQLINTPAKKAIAKIRMQAKDPNNTGAQAVLKAYNQALSDPTSEQSTALARAEERGSRAANSEGGSASGTKAETKEQRRARLMGGTP